MTAPPILLSGADGIATITLNRPEVFNAFNRPMLLALGETLQTAARDTQVRAVLITGAGKAFCAGAELSPQTDRPAEGAADILRNYYNPIVQAMRTMPKPVVVAVNGAAAGAGMSLALAGDILLAADTASFSCAFSKVGLAPDAGSSYLLPRIAGHHRALALMLLSPRLDADAAHRAGLVWQVFAAGELLAQAESLARQLAAGPTHAFALTKQALLASGPNTFETQLELEAQLQQQAASSADFAEGVAAFREKRLPKYSGR